MKTTREIESAMQLNKAALVDAHRNKDWGRARELSRERESLKKHRPRKCAVCGIAIQKKSTHCRMHSVYQRCYRNKLDFAAATTPPPKSKPKEKRESKLGDQSILIVKMLAIGKSIKEIASELQCSPKTVEWRWSQIRAVLGVSNHVQATLWALRNQVIKLEGINA